MSKTDTYKTVHERFMKYIAQIYIIIIIIMFPDIL